MPNVSQPAIHPALYASLSELGLTEHEKNLYALSLLLGSTSIANLAEHLKMPRPNVYKVIAGLEKRGLAKFSENRAYMKTFLVESPSVIAELLRKKREEVNELNQAYVAELPNLLGLYKQCEAPTKIKLVQGKQQFLQTYIQVFEEARGDILFFGNGREFVDTIGKELGELRIGRRIERKIPIRALTLTDFGRLELKSSATEFREVRLLKQAPTFLTSFYVFANKAVFWQPRAPIAFIMEDEYFVEMLRSMFELLWMQGVPDVAR